MRTVILLAGIAIANAINIHWASDSNTKFYAVCIIFCIGMDILEFLDKLGKK